MQLRFLSIGPSWDTMQGVCGRLQPSSRGSVGEHHFAPSEALKMACRTRCRWHARTVAFPPRLGVKAPRRESVKLLPPNSGAEQSAELSPGELPPLGRFFQGPKQGPGRPKYGLDAFYYGVVRGLLAWAAGEEAALCARTEGEHAALRQEWVCSTLLALHLRVVLLLLVWKETGGRRTMATV